MRPYRNTIFDGIAHARQHRLGITRVKTAGDIHRGDQGHQFSVGAAALAQIGV